MMRPTRWMARGIGASLLRDQSSATIAADVRRFSHVTIRMEFSVHAGLDFQAELAKASIHIPVIFMTGHGDIPMSVKAMKAGTVDFLTKPFRVQDMLDAVAMAIERDRERREEEKRLSDLRCPAREREVMGLVTAGMMNTQIAGELELAEITVKIHRGHIMGKCRGNSRP